MDNVGAMRELVQIVSYTVERDKYGGEQKTEVLSDLIWAKVETKGIGTTEVFGADQNAPREFTVFTMRFRSISYVSELKYRGERYKIHGVIPDAKRAYVMIETYRIIENG